MCVIAFLFSGVNFREEAPNHRSSHHADRKWRESLLNRPPPGSLLPKGTACHPQQHPCHFNKTDDRTTEGKMSQVHQHRGTVLQERQYRGRMALCEVREIILHPMNRQVCYEKKKSRAIFTSRFFFNFVYSCFTDDDFFFGGGPSQEDKPNKSVKAASTGLGQGKASRVTGRLQVSFIKLNYTWSLIVRVTNKLHSIEFKCLWVCCQEVLATSCIDTSSW